MEISGKHWEQLHNLGLASEPFHGEIGTDLHLVTVSGNKFGNTLRVFAIRDVCLFINNY